MASYNITASNSKFLRALDAHMQAGLHAALVQAAEMTRSAWQEGILRAPGVWSGIKDRYANSIKIDISPDGKRARIYSDDKDAEALETGRPPRDLKRMLDTSIKTRMVKNGKNAGKRYMIIPFRHNTPGNTAHANAMPVSVYKQVSNPQLFGRSAVKSVGIRPNGLGVHDLKSRSVVPVKKNSYEWGERLKASGNHNGMVAFRTSSGKQNSTSYMTFRVMMEGSSGWIVPAKPGLFIVKKAAEAAQKVLQQAVDAVANGTG